MKYKITKQELEGGFRSEEIGDEEITIIEADSSKELMKQMDWDVNDDLILNSINSETTFYYRYDDDTYDDELYVMDGENCDGIRIEIKILD